MLKPIRPNSLIPNFNSTIFTDDLMTMLTLILNGTPTQLNTPSANLLIFLENQGLTQGRFAVEVDGVLIPKSRLADTAITDQMRVEVVQAVGGG